jgi:hypothetical protein
MRADALRSPRGLIDQLTPVLMLGMQAVFARPVASSVSGSQAPALCADRSARTSRKPAHRRHARYAIAALQGCPLQPSRRVDLGGAGHASADDEACGWPSEHLWDNIFVLISACLGGLAASYWKRFEMLANDTCGIRTHAGRPHQLSRPTP